MKLRLTLLSIVFLLAAAARAEGPWLDSNMNVLKQHIIPRYQQLADASRTLDVDTIAFCRSPDAAGLEKVRQDFHLTMDGWMGVQHLRAGPVDMFNRYQRFMLWPDKHNIATRQLAKLLDEQDLKLLQPRNFIKSSVAVQGLSALERLLFKEGITASDFGRQGNATYSCQLAKAIGHNLAEMSQELVDDWRTEPPPFHMLTSATAGQNMKHPKTNLELAGTLDITASFYNSMYTELLTIVAQKLMPSMGENVASAKQRSAESWRSRRSLRNIILNLEAVESLYQTGFAPPLQRTDEGKTLDQQIRQGFAACYTTANTIDKSLYDAVEDEAQRPALESLLASSRQLTALISGPLPQILAIPFSFNALDGD